MSLVRSAPMAVIFAVAAGLFCFGSLGQEDLGEISRQVKAKRAAEQAELKEKKPWYGDVELKHVRATYYCYYVPHHWDWEKALYGFSEREARKSLK